MKKMIDDEPAGGIASGLQGKDSENGQPGLRHPNDSLHEHMRFERLLSELSTKFISLPADQVDKEIEAGIKLIVDYLSLDRGGLSEFSDDATSLITTHTYSVPGADQPYSKRLHLKIPAFTAKLRRGERIVFCRQEEIPATWTLEKAYSLESGIKSCVGFPLKVGGVVLGALTFDMLRSEVIWPEMLIKQMSTLSEIFGNALARKRAGLQIQEDMQFEELLSEISTRFISLPTKDVDQVIGNALQQLMDFLHVDRATIFQYDKSKAAYYISHQRSRKGIQKMPKQFSEKEFPWMANKIKQGLVCSFANIDQLPVDATIDRKNIQGVGDKAALVIPLLVSETTIGALSIDSVRQEKTWSEKILKRSRLIGEVFANTMKHKDDEQELHKALSRIRQLKKQIEADYNYLRDEIDLEHDFHEIIGESAPLKHVLFKIDQVAPNDTTVLILGETGTGKELVARAVHNRSPRKDRPLVKVNCAALSPMLIESELFGHEKGAFTGADRMKPGRFETAHGTSFLLDEIGELPLALQAKLLRVIQNGEFERIGSSRTMKVDVRIIAATNKDLDEEVQKGRFRQDLLYRLNVFPITIPPLRQRRQDIPLLVNRFVNTYGKKLGKEIKCIPETAMAELQSYSWPGNVRELENTIERAIINTEGSTLRLLDRLDSNSQEKKPYLRMLSLTGAAGPSGTLQKRSFAQMQREYIIQVLEETDWTVQGPQGAAQILDLRPSTLRSKMKRLGIKRSCASNTP